jgi:signal transduction histidine kinase
MLAAGIAHDLNNLLAPVLMAPTLLREHANNPRDARILDILEKSARRGSELVREILGFAHGATGTPRPLQLNPLLDELAAFIEESFPKSIVLQRSIPPQLWPMFGSATQVHQVLLNLCVNARDAMPAGGTLRMRAENAELDEAAARSIPGARAGKWVVLHVEDTGTGIAPDVLTRIWDPFFTTKVRGQGSGLGLPTVRALVENHGGFVAVDTKLGRGTRFHVYLPAGTDHAGGEPLAAPDGQEELFFGEGS